MKKVKQKIPSLAIAQSRERKYNLSTVKNLPKENL